MSTGIEWTDETWNPVVGCSIVSPGCTNCYAMKMAARLDLMSAAQRRENPDSDSYAVRGPAPLSHYAGMTQPSKAGAVWTGKVALAPDAILTKPLGWKKPRKVFVNSMGDLFHESVPDDWIDRVFAVMALAPQHTFQVLTKRSARMREYMIPALAHRVGMIAFEMVLDDHAARRSSKLGAGVMLKGDIPHLKAWPLPNVWLGVSAEDQRRADERIPDLLATPAAVRFVSAEPLLGPIDFGEVVRRCTFSGSIYEDGKTHPLGWVIVGGESGPGARPMHPDWARSIRDQCAAAGVPFFFKQWGEWADNSAVDPKPACAEERIFTARGEVLGVGVDWGRHGSVEGDWKERGAAWMSRVGKRRAGSALDGVEHKEWPR